MIGIALIVIIAGYVALAAGVTYALVKFGATPRAKWAIGLGSLFAFLVLAVWDEIWGFVHLRHLCATEGGIKVYRTVALGPEYWTEDGSPKFISFQAGNFFRPFLDGRYQVKSGGQTLPGWPEIVQDENALVDLQTKDRLAVHINFWAGRGWLLHATGGHINRRSCPSQDANWGRMIIKSVFSKATSR